MNIFRNAAPNRLAVVNALAITGFIALMALSLWLAVSSTRFVPSVVGRIGTAAVYLGSVFTPSPTTASLTLGPSASTTIPFGEASSTIAANIASVTPVLPPKKVMPTAGKEITSTVALDGLPDFFVKIDTIGYLATSSASSFVASSTVPAGDRPAVTFTIKNIGAKATGSWRWSASIPTQTTYTYQSDPQPSLAPGDSIDYTMGFDQAAHGANQVISITANFDKAVVESNMSNDTASTTITILGS